MTTRKKPIAIDRAVTGRTALARAWLLALGLALPAAVLSDAALADPVGTVTDVSGALVARKADGTVKVLSQRSSVDSGDTLVSEKGTYARVRFVDESNITLRPDTQFKIENFSYDAAKPDGDNAIFRLIKGGLRSVTGLLGQRNKSRFALNTPTATVGIRGTTFIADYEPPETTTTSDAGGAAVAASDLQADVLVPVWALPLAAVPAPRQLPLLAASALVRSDAGQPLLSVQPPSPAQPLQLAQAGPNGPGGGLNPGLYVQVLDGLINVSNNGGSQNFAAGQFGFVPGLQQPPIILPNNPGLQFQPPPAFNQTPSSNGSGAKPGQVDCVVR